MGAALGCWQLRRANMLVLALDANTWGTEMSTGRPISLTPRQRFALRRLRIVRLMLIRQLKELPSKAELARELHVSERTIGRAMSEQESINEMPAAVSLRELAGW